MSLARRETNQFSLTSRQVLNYLSPELVRQELYTENTDIWSFGCIIYEMLTLKKPFDGENSFQILNSILNTEPELVFANSTETFEFILKNSMAKDQKTRMTSLQILNSLVGNVSFRFTSKLDKTKKKSFYLLKDDVEKYKCHKILNGHKWSVYSLLIAKNGHLISSSLDETIKVWDIAKGECLKSLKCDENDIYLCLAINEANQLVTGSLNRKINVWDLESGESVKSFNGHDDKINALVFTKDGRLISGSGDRQIKIWNIDQEENCVGLLTGHDGSVRCLAIGKNDELISGSSDFTIKVWDVSKQECLRTLYGHSDAVRALIVEKETGQIYSGSNDKSIKIWSLENGENDECVKTLIGHQSDVCSLVMSRENELVSVSADGLIKIWDLTSDKRALVLEGHQKSVLCLALGSNGELVTGSEDKTIRVWKI